MRKIHGACLDVLGQWTHVCLKRSAKSWSSEWPLTACCQGMDLATSAALKTSLPERSCHSNSYFEVVTRSWAKIDWDFASQDIVDWAFPPHPTKSLPYLRAHPTVVQGCAPFRPMLQSPFAQRPTTRSFPPGSLRLGENLKQLVSYQPSTLPSS